jgi:hypothetical protein
MEEGSLVQEALQYMQQAREGGAHDGLQNALWIDAFLLEETATPTPRSFQKLATICQDLNASLQTTLLSYPWHVGGDGPVFGAHVSSGCFHLRATCRYGANVDDEWVAIAGVIALSKIFVELAFLCWDVDDGHVLLIESALQLPPWVDDISPSACRHRCWVAQGSIALLRPESRSEEQLTLKGGIARLISQKGLERPVSVQSAIENRIRGFQDAIKVSPPDWTSQLHRAALVLPRHIADLIHGNPQLVNCAVTVFSDMSHSQQPPGRVDFSDLVWTSHPFAKTSYAMLRTLVTPAWTTEDFIPVVYKGIETTRMKRACLVESTPHLAHALQVGMRLAAGFDYILAQQESLIEEVTPRDRIMKYWAAMDIECGGNSKWLQQAFLAGPNHAVDDLRPLVACLLHNVDLKDAFPCPLSRPEKQLQTLVKQQLKQSEANIALDVSMPSPGDVDDDTWMHFTDADLEREHNARQQDTTFINSTTHRGTSIDEEEQQEALTNMLDSFQGFVDTKSEVEGISHDMAQNQGEPTCHDFQLQDDKIEINPRVFMHLLHKVLKSSPQEIREVISTSREDSYFSDDDDDDELEEDEQVMALMNAMDDELYERGHMEKKSSPAENDVVVLSNLLESLDVSSGGPGPVQNMLKEMGMEPPDFPSEKANC